ncbi:Hypp7972 [Branchiostoma lanceolatum]|uniref:Hypp7972 protein n=1 Tax=Branchiostoma lanceolatum TaxID=7740 RepID=A0A8J9Z4N7_BRALA|nr:Hypp7972 [Branchiostoma lanceolatum]
MKFRLTFSLALCILQCAHCVPVPQSGEENEQQLMNTLKDDYNLSDEDEQVFEELINDEEGKTDHENDINVFVNSITLNEFISTDVPFRVHVMQVLEKFKVLSDEELDRVKTMFITRMGEEATQKIFDEAYRIYMNEQAELEDLEGELWVDKAEAEAFETVVKDVETGADPMEEDEKSQYGIEELATDVMSLPPDLQQRFRALLIDRFGEEQARILLDEINEIKNNVDSKIDNEWQDKNLTQLDPEEEDIEEGKTFWHNLGAKVPEYLLEEDPWPDEAAEEAIDDEEEDEYQKTNQFFRKLGVNVSDDEESFWDDDDDYDYDYEDAGEELTDGWGGEKEIGKENGDVDGNTGAGEQGADKGADEQIKLLMACHQENRSLMMCQEEQIKLLMVFHQDNKSLTMCQKEQNKPLMLCHQKQVKLPMACHQENKSLMMCQEEQIKLLMVCHQESKSLTMCQKEQNKPLMLCHQKQIKLPMVCHQENKSLMMCHQEQIKLLMVCHQENRSLMMCQEEQIKLPMVCHQENKSLMMCHQEQIKLMMVCHQENKSLMMCQEELIKLMMVCHHENKSLMMCHQEQIKLLMVCHQENKSLMMCQEAQIKLLMVCHQENKSLMMCQKEQNKPLLVSQEEQIKLLMVCHQESKSLMMCQEQIKLLMVCHQENRSLMMCQEQIKLLMVSVDDDDTAAVPQPVGNNSSSTESPSVDMGNSQNGGTNLTTQATVPTNATTGNRVEEDSVSAANVTIGADQATDGVPPGEQVADAVSGGADQATDGVSEVDQVPAPIAVSNVNNQSTVNISGSTDEFPANVPTAVNDDTSTVPPPVGNNISSTESPSVDMGNSQNGGTNLTTAATVPANATTGNRVEEDSVSAANVTIGTGDQAGNQGNENDLYDWANLDDDDEYSNGEYGTTVNPWFL